MSENYVKIKMQKSDYKKLVEPYYDMAINTLADYIAINSVLDESTASESKPFGNGVDKALAFVAKLGESMGFKVNRCDNYVTELIYGEGDKILDIYAHCDVVPVKAEKWTRDPFKLTIEDDVMYGRGTSDDKGPGLACLFAVKALMDNNLLESGYKLRFLFGGNEENNSYCLKHYFETMKKEYPTIGFSPDADFPVIYGEKSIYAYRADYDLILPTVKNFSLGSALNIVLDEATCVINDNEDRIKAELLSYLMIHPEVEANFDGNTLHFIGKPYHGSMPWNGVNAGLHLLNFLGYLYSIDALKTLFNDYSSGIGQSFLGNYSDKYFTETSYNVGKISYDGRTISLFVNLRFPPSYKKEEVLKNVEEKTNAKVTLLSGSEGFVADPESDFIKILVDAYRKETGDIESQPLAIGGGTYARESKNSVAFGPAFPGRDYRMHGDDEFFPVSDFYDAMQIYARTIRNLALYLSKGILPF